MPSRPPVAAPAGPRNPGGEILTCGHRPLVALALLVLLAAPTPAQELSARDYGARRGWQNATATRKAIRQALSAPLVDPDTGDSVVYRRVHLEGGPYFTDRPILPPSNCCIRGDIGQTKLNPTGAWPALALFKPDPLGQVLTASNFLPLSARYDGSQSAPFATWGYHTRAAGALFSPGSVLSVGPQPGGWSSVPVLTLDAWIVAEKPLLGGPIMAVVDKADPVPYIWAYDADYHRYWLKVRTTDAAGGDERTHTFEWTGPDAGELKAAFEVNLTLGEFHVAMNGMEREILATSQLNGFGPGRKLVNNDLRSHWCFAAASKVVAGSDWYAAAPTPSRFNDLGLAGFSLWRARRYAWHGAGTAPTRPDGGAIDDHYRFLYAAPGVLAILPMYDTPEDVAADRFLHLWTPNGDQAIWFLSPAHGSNWASTINQRFEGITVEAGYNGPAILTGLNLDTMFIDGGSFGGYGVLAFQMGANYKTRFERWDVGGTIVSLHAYYGMLHVHTMNVRRSGDMATFHLAGIGGSLVDVFLVGVGQPRTFFKLTPAQAGGNLVIKDVTSDFETSGPAQAAPTESLISVGVDQVVPEMYVSFEGFVNGDIPDSAVDVDLWGGDLGSLKFPARFKLDGYSAYNRRQAKVRVRGPLWKVEGQPEFLAIDTDQPVPEPGPTPSVQVRKSSPADMVRLPARPPRSRLKPAWTPPAPNPSPAPPRNPRRKAG
jgi:hypothetical protein